MAPGERNEIMIDLVSVESIDFMAEFIPLDPEDNLLFMSWFNQKSKVLELQTDPFYQPSGKLVKKLNNIKLFSDSEIKNAVKRNIHLEMDDENLDEKARHNLFSINGKAMNMKNINQRVNKGDVEVWTVTGEMTNHPFHIHGVSFQVLTHLGEKPDEADLGWKDTVVVGGKPTKLVMRFDYEADDENPFMYHCHILEHEDGGMMGQFVVVEPDSQ